MYSLYALSSMLSSGFTSDFRFMTVYILPYHLCSIPPVSFSYLIIPWVFLLDITYYLSTYSCMLVLTTRFLMHVYDSDLSTHVCLSMHSTWHSHHHSLGSSDYPESSCLPLRAWSVWILPVADLRGATVAWISSRSSEALSFQAPCTSLEFSFCKLVSAFCTIHTYISFCILVFMLIGDVKFL